MSCEPYDAVTKNGNDFSPEDKRLANTAFQSIGYAALARVVRLYRHGKCGNSLTLLTRHDRATLLSFGSRMSRNRGTFGSGWNRAHDALIVLTL